MGSGNRTDNDIVNTGNSRFSAQQRAELHEENSRAYMHSSEGRKKRRSPAESAQRQDIPAIKEKKKTPPVKQTGNGRSAKKKQDNEVKQKKRREKPVKREDMSGSRNESVRKSVKERKKISRRENRLIMVMVMFLAVASVVVLFFSMFFKTVDINIINPGIYSDESILEKTGIKEGSNLILIDKRRIEEKLQTELPYVEKTEIVKKFPDAVTVTVTYAEPAMAVDTGGGYVLLNSAGKVLDNASGVLPDSAAVVEGLIVLNAEPGRKVEFTGEGAADILIGLSQQLEQYGITGITSYDLKNISDIKIVIDYRIEVLLGTLADSEEKLQFGSEVLKKTIENDSENAYLVDLKDKKRAYVRNKGDTNVNFDDAEALTEETTENIVTEEYKEEVNVG